MRKPASLLIWTLLSLQVSNTQRKSDDNCKVGCVCSKEEAKVTVTQAGEGVSLMPMRTGDLSVGDYYAASQVAKAVTRDPPAKSQNPPLIHSSFTHLLM
jgi:hypothetical protein